MNQTPPPSTNPRRRSRTAQYRAAKVRQGERWSALHAAHVREMERLWMAPEQAWRRWQASDPETAPNPTAGVG